MNMASRRAGGEFPEVGEDTKDDDGDRRSSLTGEWRGSDDDSSVVAGARMPPALDDGRRTPSGRPGRRRRRRRLHGGRRIREEEEEERLPLLPSWDHFDLLREQHVLAAPPSSPSDVYRVSSSLAVIDDGSESAAVDCDEDPSSSATACYYNLRHLTSIAPLTTTTTEAAAAADEGENDGAGAATATTTRRRRRELHQSSVDAAGGALLALHHFNRGISDVVPEVEDYVWRSGERSGGGEGEEEEAGTDDAESSNANEDGDAELRRQNEERRRRPPCRARFTVDFLDDRGSPLEASRLLVEDVLQRRKGGEALRRRRRRRRRVQQSGSRDTGADADSDADASAYAIPPLVPTALVGSALSSVTSSLAALGGAYGLPQFSALARSSSLDNRDRYPLFGRTAPSAQIDAVAAVEYFVYELGLGAEQFGVVHVQGDAWGESFAQDVRREAQRLGASVRVEAIPAAAATTSDATARVKAVSDAVGRLRSSGLRHFLAALSYEDYVSVAVEAQRSGIMGEPGYFWAFAAGEDDFASRINGTSLDGEEKRAELIKASKGSAVIASSWRKDNDDERFRAFERHWDELRRRDGEGRKYFDVKLRDALWSYDDGIGSGGSDEFREQLELSEDPTPSAALTYEAVLAAAFAICDAEAAAATAAAAISLSSSSSFGPPPGPASISGGDVMDAFDHNVTFRGLYGQVSGSARAQYRWDGLIHTVSNLLPDAPDEDGKVRMKLVPTHSREGTRENHGGGGGNERSPFSSSWQTLVEFVYSDNTTNAPPPLYHPISSDHSGHIHHSTDSQIVTVGYVLCGIVVLTSLCCSVWTYRLRSCPVFKAAQPAFLLIVSAGTMIISCALIPLGIVHSAEIESGSAGMLESGMNGGGSKGLDAACMSSAWLIIVGFSLTFSALYAKEVRISRLLNREMRRVKVTAGHVMKYVAGLVGANVLILTVWTAVAPVRYERLVKAGGQTMGMCVLPPDPSDAGKTWWVGILFASLVLFVNVTNLAAAVRQVYLTRHVETEYSESWYLAASVSIIVQASFVGVPIIAASNVMDHNAMHMIVSILVFVACEATLLLLFVPKAYYLRKYRRKQEHREKERCRKRKTPAWAMKSFPQQVRRLTLRPQVPGRIASLLPRVPSMPSIPSLHRRPNFMKKGTNHSRSVVGGLSSGLNGSGVSLGNGAGVGLDLDEHDATAEGSPGWEDHNRKTVRTGNRSNPSGGSKGGSAGSLGAPPGGVGSSRLLRPESGSASSRIVDRPDFGFDSPAPSRRGRAFLVAEQGGSRRTNGDNGGVRWSSQRSSTTIMNTERPSASALDASSAAGESLHDKPNSAEHTSNRQVAYVLSSGRLQANERSGASLKQPRFSDDGFDATAAVRDSGFESSAAESSAGGSAARREVGELRARFREMRAVTTVRKLKPQKEQDPRLVVSSIDITEL